MLEALKFPVCCLPESLYGAISLSVARLRRVTSISFGLRPLVLRRLAGLGGEGGDEGRVVGVVLLTRKSMDKGSK
ncbi:MAG: hypothetical protein RIA62_01785 [Cyclobacteriaceae bacterium]